MPRGEEKMKSRRIVFTAVIWLLGCAGCSQLYEEFPLASKKCNACHDSLPATQVHTDHVLNEKYRYDCVQCHTGYYDGSGWIDESLHRNGVVDTATVKCDMCHNYLDCEDCHGLPPTDPRWFSPTAVRAHEIHDTHDTLHSFHCSDCHAGYDAEKGIIPVRFEESGRKVVAATMHDNDTIDVKFDIPRKPSYMGPDPVFRNDSCFNLYCHGAQTFRGNKQAISIDDGMPQDTTRCWACHDIDSLALFPMHADSGHAEVFRDCLTCHWGFKIKDMLTVDSLHYNGVIDTVDKWCRNCHTTGWNVR